MVEEIEGLSDSAGKDRLIGEIVRYQIRKRGQLTEKARVLTRHQPHGRYFFDSALTGICHEMRRILTWEIFILADDKTFAFEVELCCGNPRKPTFMIPW